MGIFSSTIDKEKEKNTKQSVQNILNNVQAGGSSKVKPTVVAKVEPVATGTKKTIAKIIPAGSTPLPEIDPKGLLKTTGKFNAKTEVISAPNKNIVEDPIEKTKIAVGQLLGNQDYDPSSVEGVIKNTIKGLPKATTDTLVSILQGIARTVGTVGITAGNAFAKDLGLEQPFADEIQTDNQEGVAGVFAKALFGGKPVKTLGKTIADTGFNIKDTASKAGVDISDTQSKFVAAPLVLGSIALDLSGFGGKAGVKSFVEGEIPETFFKYIAGEKSVSAIDNTLLKIGLTDDVARKQLSSELASARNVDEAKTALLDFEIGAKNTDYRISHQISESRPASSLDDLDNVVTELKSKGYLTKYDITDLNKLKKMQGNPDMEIKIYRASPKNELNEGDWVTTSKTYANDIKNQNGGKVHEYTVKANEIQFPKNLDDLPSLARFSAFKYQPEEKAAGMFAQKIVPKKSEMTEVKPESAKDLLKTKYPDVDISVYEKDGEINLSKIIVPKSDRNLGVGTKAMNDLIKYADDTNQKITLTPTADYGGNKNKLIDFYKRFDFVENKGKNKDFSTRELMYRSPKESKVKVQESEKSVVSKPKEKLPDDLQQMKDYIEIKEEAIKNNPMQKLVKYQSSSRSGELPQLNGKGDTGKGKFNVRGDVIIDEIMGYKFDANDANDVEDVRTRFEKFMEQKAELKKMKEEFQSKRVDYVSKKNTETTKVKTAEADEKALERISKNAETEKQAQIEKAERADRIKKDLEATQKRLVDERNYKLDYKQKVKEARQVSIKKDSLFQTLKRSLAPVKHLDKKTQNIFRDWKRRLLVGKELAEANAKEFGNIPEKKGMDIINAYEAGKDTEYSKDLKTAFDSLFKQARAEGLDLPYRDNYLPHVYDENSIEIKNAIANYMADKGVEKYIIDDYMDGIGVLTPEMAASLKLNPSFTKERSFNTYAQAAEYGLHPKYKNPAQLVGHYRQELEKALANREFMKELETNAKILPASIAPREWDEIKLTYGGDRWFAPKEFAKVINGQIGDVENLGFIDKSFNITANVSKKMQEIALSAGVPKSNINFFSTGIAIKELTSGNIKALSPFIRANFNNRSIKYFEKNSEVIKDMANQGIDLSNRLGNYADAYNSFSGRLSDLKKAGKKISDPTNDNIKEFASQIKDLAGDSFDKLFNEKTFASFMPQLYIQTFKDASKKAVKKGLSKAEADEFAAGVVRNIFGLVESLGRTRQTEDKLSATFFAPKFRESLINVILNNVKSITTQIGNPKFYRNRRLVLGMAITYGLYNALNQKLNKGDSIWENENGHEFDLKIPRKNGEIVYIPFMPSQLAFARNMISGVINTAKGDLKTATQKFGGLFSMPVKTTTEIITNADYFGREIYKDTDTSLKKAEKIALYVGLSVNHPYIKEIVNQIGDKKPLYQSISIALEAPLKFSTQDAIAKSQFYDAMDKLKIEDIRAKEKFMPTYDKIRSTYDSGDQDGASEMIEDLSDEDYAIYKSIRATAKRAETIKNKTSFTKTYNEIRKLKLDGKDEEFQSRLDALSDDEYKSYKALKDQFDGKIAK